MPSLAGIALSGSISLAGIALSGSISLAGIALSGSIQKILKSFQYFIIVFWYFSPSKNIG